MGPEWKVYLAQVSDLYQRSCDMAVDQVSSNPGAALAYLNQAVAYRTLLRTDERTAMAQAGVPLDNPPTQVTSHPMALDSEGRARLARQKDQHRV